MAVGAWGWSGLTFGQVRGGFLLVLDSVEVESSTRRRLDWTYHTQVGEPGPATVEFDAYTEGVSRATLKGKLKQVDTLTGPDGESWDNMLLLGYSRQMPINATGKRVTRLRFREDLAG